ESLLLKTRLTPIDYAEAWALTHYLAQRHGPDFVKYLKALGQVPPLHPRTPAEHLAEFRKFFGDDLAKLDKRVDDYIHKLSRQKGYDRLPYYAVIFQQPLGGGMVLRGAKVSQSPQIIQQWVEQFTSPQGGLPDWQVFSCPTRAWALLTAEQWMRTPGY